MKKALTLVEILLTFSIMALVIHTIMVSMKPDRLVKNKSIQYAYTNVLDNLDGIAKEIVKEQHLPEFKFLCSEMGAYLNHTGEIHCDLNNSFGYRNDNKKFLQSNINFNNETPNITLENGMQVFITSMISGEEYDKRFDYYLVYVDIVGESKPTQTGHYIIAQDAKNYPEVFAFAIVPSGGVVPLGIAQIDKVLLPTYYERFEKSNIMTYHEALHNAWGYYKKNTSPPFDETETYTYTRLIEEDLNRHSSLINYEVPTTLYDDIGDSNCIAGRFARTDVCKIKFKVNKAF